MSKCQDTYGEVKEFVYPTSSVPVEAIVRVHIPELTAEEREKRMKSVYHAAERLIKAGLKAEADRRKRDYQ